MSPTDVMTAPEAASGPQVLAPAQPKAADPAVRARRMRRLRYFLFAVGGLALAGTGFAGYVASQGGFYAPLETLPALEASKLEIKPEGVYVVVDTHANKLRVYKDGELLREAICSTGSGTVLKDPRNGKTWTFDTPYGERKVLRKTRDPIWYKPDWAFIEEGTLPPKNPADRVDDISLGKYGLYMGDGYIIHGTIFQSLLGRRLTHGCVRLGDADLEYVFENVPLGSRVFLY